jgi:hypothetical protein
LLAGLRSLEIEGVLHLLCSQLLLYPVIYRLHILVPCYHPGAPMSTLISHMSGQAGQNLEHEKTTADCRANNPTSATALTISNNAGCTFSQ